MGGGGRGAGDRGGGGGSDLVGQKPSAREVLKQADIHSQ